MTPEQKERVLMLSLSVANHLDPPDEWLVDAMNELNSELDKYILAAPEPTIIPVHPGHPLLSGDYGFAASEDLDRCEDGDDPDD